MKFKTTQILRRLKMIKIYTATFKGYADDASYYINGDATGYDYYNTTGSMSGDHFREDADVVLSEMRADYGTSAYITDCSETTFLDTPDYGSQLKGDCIEYTIVYYPIETVATWKQYYKHYTPGNDDPADGYWSLKSDMVFPARDKLLPWQARGLMYTRTGYGQKIPTSKQLFVLNRWRRVYCDIFSNSGVCYVIVDGQEVNVDDCNMQS